MTRHSGKIALLAALVVAALTGVGAWPAQGAGAAAAQTAPLLRVGTSGDYTPFSLLTPADDAATGAGNYSGLDIEVARRFANDRGYSLEFVPFKWPDLAHDLAAGRFDVAMSGVTMRGDRSVIGRFTIPVVASYAVALSWSGAHATSIGQLNRRDRRIAVNAGGYLEGVARKVFPAAQIIALPNNDAVHMALLDRWTDAVVTDNLEEKQWAAGAADVVRIGPLSDDRKAYLVRADREDLAAELDTWLLAHEHDGTLARLRAGITGEAGGAPVSAPLPALINAIVERMSIMPLVWAAKDKAALPVQDSAQEQRVLDAAVAAVTAAAKAASRPPPDPEPVRTLFRAMIEAGKEIQQRLADRRYAQEQQARQRKDARSATSQSGSAVESPNTAGAEIEIDAQKTATALFDLDTQIRPAIAHITVKLARLLVALDTPLTSEAVQRPLSAALAGQRLRTGHTEEMSSSIAALSVANSANRRD